METALPNSTIVDPLGAQIPPPPQKKKDGGHAQYRPPCRVSLPSCSYKCCMFLLVDEVRVCFYPTLSEISSTSFQNSVLDHYLVA